MRVEMPEDHGIVEKTLKERDTRSGGWHRTVATKRPIISMCCGNSDTFY